jgi:hypothetical protein
METRLKKWRSGIEAVVSNLKRGYQLLYSKIIFFFPFLNLPIIYNIKSHEVYLYSNTIVDNQLAATGGNRMIMHNNYIPERVLTNTLVKENQYFNQDTIQAVRFVNSEGKIVKKDSGVRMAVNAVLEYSVVFSGTHQYYIWCKASGEGKVSVKFDTEEEGSVEISGIVLK